MKPDGNKPGGTDPVGKLSNSAAMKGGPGIKLSPPPPFPPPQEVKIKIGQFLRKLAYSYCYGSPSETLSKTRLGIISAF